jgi:hypothetical protein
MANLRRVAESRVVRILSSPAQFTFYKAQPTICKLLIISAQKLCSDWKRKMAPESAISFDGSWSHRRAAPHCFRSFIDPDQGKIVDFEVVTA